MPQIWPMNWVLLFLTFIMIFMFFTTLMYFFKFGSHLSQDSGEEIKTDIVTCDWKW